MRITSAILTAVFAAAMLLPASVAQSFWYGDTESLDALLGEEAITDFIACLDDKVLPSQDRNIDSSVLRDNWYSDLALIVNKLSSDGKLALNQCLTTHILLELDAKLEFNDNNDGEEGVTINEEGASSGYTLLNPIIGHGCDQAPPDGVPAFPVYKNKGRQLHPNSCGTILIDMEGNIVKEWPLVAVPAKMLPDGNVLGMALTFDNGPPIGGMQSLVQMDWCGNETWRWSGPSVAFPTFGGARVHHDFQREGNPVGYFAPDLKPKLGSGKTLVLSNIISPNPPYLPLIVPEISSFELLEDAVYEVDINGNVVWEWYPYEHFDQMGFEKDARDGIRNVSVAGIGGVERDEETTDWQHLNSVSYLGPNKWYDEDDYKTWRFHPDNIIYDSRTANYIAIIARVDHPEGKWKVGDIIWRVGPSYPLTDKKHKQDKVDQIIGPHMAHMIPQGLPGEGNILVFDNGGIAGYGSLLPGLPGTYPATFRDYSRVIEFNPKTQKVVWEYKCPETGERGRRFYSRLMSGAQRLENGNTLITESVNGRIFEVNNQGDIVWEYIHKEEYANGSLPLLDFLPPTTNYRAYRVPAAWLPSDRTCTE